MNCLNSSRKMAHYVSTIQVAQGLYAVKYARYGKYQFTCTAIDNHNLKGRSRTITVVVRMRMYQQEIISYIFYVDCNQL